MKRQAPLVGVGKGLLWLVTLWVAGCARCGGPGFRAPGEGQAEGVAVSPVLTREERRELLTFERPCWKREDCEAPLGCLSFNGEKGYCLASTCLTDLQCEDGRTCRPLPVLGGGPLVRFCATAGLVEEGSPCEALTFRKEVSCKAGLICNGFCGRQCEPDDPSMCPQGFSCRRGPAGFACSPQCEGQVCPQGQQCVRFGGGSSICAVVEGDDCQRTPCSAGQECEASFSPEKGRWAQLECVTPCDGEGEACPSGWVCFHGACRQPCDAKDAGGCSSRRKCTLYPQEQRWMCALDSP